ncbi:MAG: hypothetical protein FDZ75_08505 [Actinobacteria bacterium]|nr:MAG: hypothetical protein FDZ75_08505 [Actinomycetota bacterium]
MEVLARTCNTERMNAERIFARIMLIIGGLFWIAAAWGAQWAYIGAPFTKALGYALIFAVGVAVVFIIGLFYENLAAMLLTAGAIAVVVWGIVAGWGTGVWATMFFFAIVPMLVSAALYALAAQMQRTCEIGE